MAMVSNSVFISYRRDVGGIVAMALYQMLTERGVDVFYDIESIRAGQFDTIILSQIEARPYFLLVLTPGTLQRCDQDGDWLRREIDHAVATGRVIVPCYTPNFDFDDFERFLPGGLGAEVRRFNAQELPQKWFKFAVQQLVEEYLVPVEAAVGVPAPDTAGEVERIAAVAAAAPSVSQEVLSAQALFEEAYNLHEAGDHDGVIARLTEAIRLNPGYAMAFNNRGYARRVSGDVDGAISDYTEALRLDPVNADAFYNRGVARAERGDVGGAIGDFSEAIRFDPVNAAAFNNRGNARAASGDVDGAIADFTEALRLDSGYATAFYNRGLARAERGDVGGAIGDFTEALSVDPGYADALYNRGVARAQSGDLDGAIADFRRGRELAPDDPDYGERLRELGQP